MQSSNAVALSAVLTLTGLATACNKTPSATDTAAPAASAAALPASTAAAPAASVAPAAAPLSGLDACLVGSWKGTGFGLKTEQVTAEGGANLSLKIAANGDSVVDFGPMSPVNGKGAGASFDFQYSGKATGTLSTPARGSITSAKADYSGLKVSTNVQIPGAGKIALFKNKPVSELAQIVVD